MEPYSVSQSPAIPNPGNWPSSRFGNSKRGKSRGTDTVDGVGSVWALPSVLAHWVQMEVEKMNWSSQCVERGRPLMASRSAELMRLLVISYLMRVPDSQALVSSWNKDPILRGVCTTAPSALELEQVLHRFPTELAFLLGKIAERVSRDWLVPPVLGGKAPKPPGPRPTARARKGPGASP